VRYLGVTHPCVTRIVAFDTKPPVEELIKEISDHQQSWGYEEGPWKEPGPSLLVAADF